MLAGRRLARPRTSARGPQRRREIAAEVAALIAFSAIANNDQVGLLLFTDRVEKVVPAEEGPQARAAADPRDPLVPARGEGDRPRARRSSYLRRVAQAAGGRLPLSDFLADGYEQALRIVGRRHDVVPVVLGDPLEEAFPSSASSSSRTPRPASGCSSTPPTRWCAARSRGRWRQRARPSASGLFQKLELDSVELGAARTTVDARSCASSGARPEDRRVRRPSRFAARRCALLVAPRPSARAPDAGAPALPPPTREAPEAASPEVKVQLGEPFVYRITLDHPPGQRCELRDPARLGGFELLDSSRSAPTEGESPPPPSRSRSRCSSSAATCSPRSPSTCWTPRRRCGPLDGAGHEGREQPARSRRRRSRAPSSRTSSPSRTSRCGAGGCSTRSLAALAVGAGLSCSGAAGRTGRRRSCAVPPAAARSTSAPARRSTRSRPRACPSEGLQREFHFRLSEIVRGYLGERFGFDALECTSDELLGRLERSSAPGPAPRPSSATSSASPTS